jgi:O-6-methylguanine DNA methyltransferase
MYQTKITTTIGDLYIRATELAIKDISFLKEFETTKTNAVIEQLEKELDEYLQGNRKSFDVSFDFSDIGTPFQQKVWQESLNIPYGAQITYQELAQKVGSPRAFRAVGGALGKNPIMILVPCHRILGKNGKLTGYAGPGEKGLWIKQQLLELELKNK